MNAKKLDARTFLEKSKMLLTNRGKTYDGGNDERSMAKIVAIFNAIHGTKLTEAQGWSFMMCLKMARLFSAPRFHQDSAEDLCAYSALLSECMADNAADNPQ